MFTVTVPMPVKCESLLVAEELVEPYVPGAMLVPPSVRVETFHVPL